MTNKVFFILVIIFILVSQSSHSTSQLKIFDKDNVIAAAVYPWSNLTSGGTPGSWGMSLVVQLEVNGKIIVDEGAPIKYVGNKSEMHDIRTQSLNNRQKVYWFENGYPDNTWQDGISGIGKSNDDDNTIVTETVEEPSKAKSLYVRYKFDIPSAGEVEKVTLRVDYEPSCIVWINGTEVFRDPYLQSPYGVAPPWDYPVTYFAVAKRDPAGKPNPDRVYPNTRNISNLIYAGFSADQSIWVEKLFPKSGNITGDEIISFFGGPFNKNLRVSIGENSLTELKIDEFMMSGKTPLGQLGPEIITISSGDGDLLYRGKFNYIESSSMVLTELRPTSGSMLGGGSGLITGAGFTEGITIKIGDELARDLQISSRMVSFKIPKSNKSGSTDVVVNLPDGGITRLDGAFTYNPFPTIEEIDPNEAGTWAGPIHELIVLGTNFLPGVTLMIGDEIITNLSYVSETELHGKLFPNNGTGSGRYPRFFGKVPVKVINPDGQSATLIDGFSFNRRPYISEITPAAGPLTGNTTITVKGKNFQNGMVVYIDGEIAQTGIVKIDTKDPNGDDWKTIFAVEAKTPPSSSTGLVDVTVKMPDGQFDIEDEGFAYNSAPVLAFIEPDNGKLKGGTRINIHGEGFLPGATVQMLFGNSYTPAKEINVISSQLIIATTPEIIGLESATLDVRVLNPDGQIVKRQKAYTYNELPEIRDVTPNYGLNSGGTTVVILGSGFLPGAKAFFGKRSATTEFLGPNRLEAVTPPISLGQHDITVVNPDFQQIIEPKAFVSVSETVYNYPNPFQSGQGTTFRFVTNENVKEIKVQIFNTNGEPIATLRREGNGQIKWSGEGLNFGLYIYHMEVELETGQVKRFQKTLQIQ